MAERSAHDSPALVARLYDEHAAMLFRYALMLLADHAGAEDAVQQVFTTLVREPRLAQSMACDGAYLRRAVRNACYSSHRRRSSRGEIDGGAPLLELVPDQQAPPDERLALERALRALTVEQREVVHLHVFEGYTFQEVADLAGTSINTVASRYRYALAHMRRILTP